MLNPLPVSDELTPRNGASNGSSNGGANGSSNGGANGASNGNAASNGLANGAYSPSHVAPVGMPLGGAPFPANQVHANQGSDSIDIGLMLTSLWRRRRLILLTFGLIVLAGTLLTLLQRPIYEATCSIFISAPSDSSPSSADSVRALLNATQPRSVGTQLAIMRSYPVQRATLKRLSPAEQQTATDYNSLEVRPQRDSDAIDIVAQSHDPQVAAHLANALRDEYMAQSQTQNRLQIAAGTREVSGQLAGALKRWKEASNALKNYKLANGTVNLSEESTARIAQVNQIEIAIRDLQAERAATVAQIASLGGQIASQPKVQTVPNTIVRSQPLEALRSQLSGLNSQRIITGKRYREGSPELQIIDSQIAEVKKQIASTPKTEINGWTRSTNPIRQGLTQDSARAQTTIKSIDARIADLRGAENRARAQEALLPEREYQLSQLVNDQSTLQQTYQLLNEKYQGLLVSENAKLATVRDLASAEAPQKPIKPRRVLNLALSVILGGFAAIAFALLAEKMDDRVRSAHGAESAAQLPVLAQIPALALSRAPALHGAKGNANLNGSANGGANTRLAPLPADSFSPLLENFRLLRTNLMQPDANGVPTMPRSVLVTSSRQEEGKSACALNLAIATALGGRKVVLIDADLRRPTLHTTLGLAATRGLSEIVRGEISLDEALQATEVPNLYFLAGGTAANGAVTNGAAVNGATTGAAELLDSDAARQVLQNAVAGADCAIFNCPPVLGHADTSILASLAQCALLVVSDQQSQGSDLAQARETLSRTGIYLPGLVLNQSQTSG